MKKIIMPAVCLILFCAQTMHAADAGNQTSLIGRAQAAIASEDQARMDGQLTSISSFPDPKAPEAMRMLLDAGANGTFTRQSARDEQFGWLEVPTESPLINAAMNYVSGNMQALREWSEAHDDAIDPNQGRYTNISGFSAKRDDSLLGRVVTGACPNSQLQAKVGAVSELLEFSNLEIDLNYCTGLTPLHEALKKTLYELGVGHPEAFETYLEIVKILLEHGAQATDGMQEEVQRAAERHENLRDQYDQIMEALSPGSSTKSACKQ